MITRNWFSKYLSKSSTRLMTTGAMLAVGLTVGCSRNALYFSESQKIAFAVEWKPDASEPVNVTLGYKRRLVAVVPPQDPQPLNPTPELDVAAHDAAAKASDKAAKAHAKVVTELGNQNADAARAAADSAIGADRAVAAANVDTQSPGHQGEALSLVSAFDVTADPDKAGGLLIKNYFASGVAARILTSTEAGRDPTDSIKALMTTDPTFSLRDPSLEEAACYAQRTSQYEQIKADEAKCQAVITEVSYDGKKALLTAVQSGNSSATRVLNLLVTNSETNKQLCDDLGVAMQKQLPQ